MKYTKEEAIEKANEFIKEVNELERKYNMTFNSDTDDVYLSFKTSERNKVWDSVKLGWEGNGSGIKVTEKSKIDKIKENALSKLTDEEKEILGLNMN
jgi:hypothetical protein